MAGARRWRRRRWLFLLLNALFTVIRPSRRWCCSSATRSGSVQEPGLNLKVPFIQQVDYFEKRVLDFDAPSVELVLGDQKRLVVDAFARYRITDPLRFRQSVGNELAFRGRLEPIIFSSLRSVLGEAPLFTILSQDRTQLMNRIKSEANTSLAGFGVELVDVRIKRADLPPENSQAVFRRMQTEREREAKELRAQGAEVGQRIRARADRERRVLIAEASGNRRSCAARATPRRSGSSPRRSARTRSSSTSTARCRPIARRWATAPPASCCRRTASSSASSTAGRKHRRPSAAGPGADLARRRRTVPPAAAATDALDRRVAACLSRWAISAPAWRWSWSSRACSGRCFPTG